MSCKLVSILFLSMATNLFGQEFFEDGSMKLSEISTDKKYGYEANPKWAVPVGKVANEYAYLKALQGPNKEKVQAQRISSCCEFESKASLFGMGLLDKWELTYEGLKKPVIVYLNSYSSETPKCINGFTFKTIDHVEKVQLFSADSIIKVTACSPTIYSVDDFLVKENFGELGKPTQNPAFAGGFDELKKYFQENPLTDEKAQKMVFRVSIAFLVTCDGKAGNFVIVTKGKGDLATYANQVLAIVNHMPQKWQPATVDGKPVDCYQVLSFTAVGGKLNNVSCR
ncbi:MAG: hypothetical protein V4580_15015 [Bacteroidota bacterium]